MQIKIHIYIIYHTLNESRGDSMVPTRRQDETSDVQIEIEKKEV